MVDGGASYIHKNGPFKYSEKCLKERMLTQIKEYYKKGKG